MNLQQIEYFLQLAKYEHVSITADFLNISQPSLSKHIAALEKDLGVRLFDRTGNRIILNKNGEDFAKYAQQSMEILNAGVLYSQSKHYETTGQITIGCYSYTSIIAQYAFSYSELNPLTTFQMIQCHSSRQSVPSDKMDFILYSSSDKEVKDNREQFWVPQSLFTERYVLVAARDYPGLPRNQEPIDLRLLKNEPFALMAQKSVLFDDITYSLCMNAGFFPKIYCQTDDFIVKVKSVNAGLALAFLPESCLSDARLLAPGICSYPLENHLAERTIYIMRHKKHLMTESALDFWNFLMDALELPHDNC